VKLNVLAIAAVAFAGLGSATAQAPAPTPAKYEAGKHYQLITPPQPAAEESGKIEVSEVFMFGCPGCNAFEPHLQKWLATLPADVSFVRIPAPWNAMADLHAHAYYAAVALGKDKEIDVPFFNEFHANRNFLDTEDKLAAFFASYGVDDATFRNTLKSVEVDAKVGRADEMIKRYKVPSTPTVVVNGKYLTQGAMAGTYQAWFEIIDELVAKERAAGAAAKAD
jgi:thiol:disulfide interchange protein DsbA